MASSQAAIDASHPWSLNMHAICHPQFLSLALDNLGPQHRKLPAAEETTVAKNKRKDLQTTLRQSALGIYCNMPATICIIIATPIFQLFLVLSHDESSHVYICPPQLRVQKQWHASGQIVWQLHQYVYIYTCIHRAIYRVHIYIYASLCTWVESLMFCFSERRGGKFGRAFPELNGLEFGRKPHCAMS